MFISLAGWTSDLFPREILVLALPNTFAREKLKTRGLLGLLVAEEGPFWGPGSITDEHLSQVTPAEVAMNISRVPGY